MMMEGEGGGQKVKKRVLTLRVWKIIKLRVINVKKRRRGDLVADVCDEATS
jgi:hypothetical protein